MMKYGLIGCEIAYSFSPNYFNALFAQLQLEASYQLFDLKQIDDIRSIFEIENLKGLNVTKPFKQSVIPFLDELGKEAEKIGAVNTIVFKNGSRIGYNTDAYGFHQSIKPFLTNKHERALILGTGGASKAVAYVLRQIGIDTIFISRNPNGKPKTFSYDEINSYMLNACKLVVNCTPTGTFPNIDDCISFPFEFLSTEHLVVDLIYNPTHTTFLKNASKFGATVLNGETMLKEQAARSWQLWSGSENAL